MTFKVGDLIMISGCGDSNVCSTCKGGACSQFVEGEYIFARVTNINSCHPDWIGEYPMDIIHFHPMNHLGPIDPTVCFTRRKHCKIAKVKPDDILEILF
jgi:hypothetical protein